MTTRAIIAGLLALFGLTSAAIATPSDIIRVEDRLFGVGSQHIYLLRTTSDNMGSYYSDRTEVWLVEVDPVTGKESLWPVYGVSRTTDFGEDGNSDTDVVTPDAIPDRVDPYEMLAARGAMPLHERLAVEDMPRPMVLEENGIIEFGYGADSNYRMERSVMEQRYLSAIETLAGRVMEAPRMGSITTRQLYEERLFLAESCKPVPFHWPLRLVPGGAAYHAVRIICGSPEDGEYDALIQFAPIAAENSEDQ